MQAATLRSPIPNPNEDPDADLLRALRSEDPYVCRRAIRAAGSRRIEAAVPVLIELLTREGGHLQREAALALGQILD